MKHENGARSYRIRFARARSRAGRGALLTLLLGLASACQTTPVTGRRSLNLFTPAEDVELGREAYAQVLAEGKVVQRGRDLDLVRRVMQRLSEVADDAGYEWEVNLLEADDTVNAFALPGGKMAVYTGILPVCGGENGLAVVMGHEIGHVVARHGTERMSGAGLANLALSAMGSGESAQVAQLGLQYLVLLPFGRAQESEADEIGLIYMARAGYDPREAVAFWQRMESVTGSGPPEFLSTHPSHETRVERLEALLPRALAEWERSRATRP
jgi:predicted Zn-dependent protease